TEPISHVLTNASASHVKTELDLRGERYEDALLQLEKYIDEALLSGYPQVTIIHGKGTGALRKGVEQFIKDRKSTRLNSSHAPICASSLPDALPIYRANLTRIDQCIGKPCENGIRFTRRTL